MNALRRHAPRLSLALFALLWTTAFLAIGIARAQSIPSGPVEVGGNGGGGGGPTGSGAATQVTFWSGASTLSGDDNLWWDNTNKRLGVETKTPTVDIDVTKARATPTKIQLKNATSAINASAEYDAISDVAQAHFGAYSTAYTHVPSMALSAGLLAEPGTGVPLRIDAPDNNQNVELLQGAQKRIVLSSNGSIFVPVNQNALASTAAISSTNSAGDFINTMGSSLGSSAYTAALRTSSATGNATLAFFYNSTTWGGSIRADFAGDLAVVAAGSGGDLDLFSGGDFGVGTFYAQLNPTRADWKTTPFRFGEATAPSAVAATSVIYADSTAHAMELSNNNDAFAPIARAVSQRTALDVTTSSSISFSTVAQVTVPIGVWSCRGQMNLSESAAGEGADCRALFSGTLGADSQMCLIESTNGAAAIPFTNATNGAGVTATTTVANIAAGSCTLDASLNVTVSGNLAWQFAQDNHVAGTLTAPAGAFLRCARM